MASIRYTGLSAPVAQVDTFTPANVEIDDIFTLTVTGLDGSTYDVSFTATAATVANVTAGLVAAWNLETHALCTPITAADNTTNLTLTADVAGVGFSVAGSATDGGGTDTQTLSRAATTANAGPAVWSDGDNWSGGSAPGGASGQDVYIDGATILYALDQSGISNTLDNLYISNSQIGTNPATGILPTYLQIHATNIHINKWTGPGSISQSKSVFIDADTVASTITIYDGLTGSNSNLPTIWLLASSASTNIVIHKGVAGVAFRDGETATIGEIKTGYISNISSDSKVYIGAGCTLTTLTQNGGNNVIRCGATTVNANAGYLKTEGAGAITTMNIIAATVTANSSGTIATVNGLAAGVLDLLQSETARTITTLKGDPGFKFKYNPAIITLTNKIQPYTTTRPIEIEFKAA